MRRCRARLGWAGLGWLSYCWVVVLPPLYCEDRGGRKVASRGAAGYLLTGQQRLDNLEQPIFSPPLGQKRNFKLHYGLGRETER